ncbi:MAG: GerMN domain-containing protein, partial [Candidatus Paceibacterota bacterium]
KSVNVEAGAATLNLKLGSRADVNNVSIGSGASTINVSVPYGVGVKVNLEAGLSTTNLNNLVKIDDNNFESSDYDTATKKINIVLRLGAATFNLNWYMPSQNVTMRKIDLYYYKRSADPEITCGSSAVLPVEREIPLTPTPIQDAINLLIKGELTAAEKAEGFSTEFPNKDFKLLGVNLDSNGVLTLAFTEVPGFTGGGSCRISILANQIIKTAEQFPEVKQVVFMPESLFQP